MTVSARCSLEQGRVEQKRDSSLKAQTRCVRAFPDAQGFALSSVEGRVAIEYLDMDPAQQVCGAGVPAVASMLAVGLDVASSVPKLGQHGKRARAAQSVGIGAKLG